DATDEPRQPYNRQGLAQYRQRFVVLAQKGGPAKRGGQLVRPVHDATDNGGIVVVRDGHAVDVQDGDAEGGVLVRDGVDVGGVIGFDRGGDLVQVGGEALAFDSADEDLRQARPGRGASGCADAPAGGVVDGEGGLVEITLELEPGLLNEALVVGIAGDGR